MKRNKNAFNSLTMISVTPQLKQCYKSLVLQLDFPNSIITSHIKAIFIICKYF